MSDICIICANNIKHMTLVSLYTERLKKNGVSYDIVYVDRYGIKENTDANRVYKYTLITKKNWTFIYKQLRNLRFRKFAIDIIKKNKYKFIIIWNEYTSFLLTDYLVKNYKEKYCINIRDYNYNNISFVQNRLAKATKYSCFNTISSERFRNFLPNNSKYLMVHSYNEKLLKGLSVQSNLKRFNEIINIVFIGRVSYPETIIKVANILSGDKRFRFYIIGVGSENIQQSLVGIDNNIILHGAFDPEETASFLEKADIIYSLNKQGEKFSDVLLPIKLYYAIHRHIPIIAYKTSYTYEYAKNISIAIGIDDNELDCFGDIIYRQYHALNKNEMDRSCDAEMKRIKDSHSKLDELIDKYICH